MNEVMVFPALARSLLGHLNCFAGGWCHDPGARGSHMPILEPGMLLWCRCLNAKSLSSIPQSTLPSPCLVCKPPSELDLLCALLS